MKCTFEALVAELRFVCSAAGDIDVQTVLVPAMNRLDPEILKGVCFVHQPVRSLWQSLRIAYYLWRNGRVQ